jgi:hypothetical protein
MLAALIHLEPRGRLRLYPPLRFGPRFETVDLRLPSVRERDADIELVSNFRWHGFELHSGRIVGHRLIMESGTLSR